MLLLEENEFQPGTPADQIQALQDEVRSLKKALEYSNNRNRFKKASEENPDLREQHFSNYSYPDVSIGSDYYDNRNYSRRPRSKEQYSNISIDEILRKSSNDSFLKEKIDQAENRTTEWTCLFFGIKCCSVQKTEKKSLEVNSDPLADLLSKKFR